MTLEEYRKLLTKTFTTKKGLNVKVKVLTSAIPFMKLIKKYGLENPEKLEPVEVAEKTNQLYHELFKNYLLEPRIDQDIGFDEIFDEDKLEIFQAIVGELTFFRLQSKSNSR